MKVRVLYPMAFQFMGELPEGGALVDVDEATARGLVAAGAAEIPAPKVERATKAPGERKAVRKPKAE